MLSLGLTMANSGSTVRPRGDTPGGGMPVRSGEEHDLNPCQKQRSHPGASTIHQNILRSKTFSWGRTLKSMQAGWMHTKKGTKVT